MVIFVMRYAHGGGGEHSIRHKYIILATIPRFMDMLVPQSTLVHVARFGNKVFYFREQELLFHFKATLYNFS